MCDILQIFISDKINTSVKDAPPVHRHAAYERTELRQRLSVVLRPLRLREMTLSYDNKVRPLPRTAWDEDPSVLADAILFF